MSLCSFCQLSNLAFYRIIYVKRSVGYILKIGITKVRIEIFSVLDQNYNIICCAGKSSFTNLANIIQTISKTKNSGSLHKL